MRSKRPAATAVLVLAAWAPAHAQDSGELAEAAQNPIANMNAQAQAFYNVEKPDAVGDWSLRVQLQLLFPKGG